MHWPTDGGLAIPAGTRRDADERGARALEGAPSTDVFPTDPKNKCLGPTASSSRPTDCRTPATRRATYTTRPSRTSRRTSRPTPGSARASSGSAPAPGITASTPAAPTRRAPSSGTAATSTRRAKGSGYDCNADYLTSYTLFPAGASEEIYNLNLTTAGRIPPAGEAAHVRRRHQPDGREVRAELHGLPRPLGRGQPEQGRRLRHRQRPADPARRPRTAHTPDRYGLAVAAGAGTGRSSPRTPVAMAKAFQTIIAATATGDYTTAPPISGAVLSLGNIVLLPSSEFPTWKGHMYAIDITKDPRGRRATSSGTPGRCCRILPDPATSRPPSRKIYTWDPTHAGLVEVVDVRTSAPWRASPGLPEPERTEHLGLQHESHRLHPRQRRERRRPDRGASARRSTRRRPSSGRPNSTSRASCPTTGRSRGRTRPGRPLAWVGADDGMLHAFDFRPGAEVFALIPPNLLKPQVDLYNNYLAGESDDGPEHRPDEPPLGPGQLASLLPTSGTARTTTRWATSPKAPPARSSPPSTSRTRRRPTRTTTRRTR